MFDASHYKLCDVRFSISASLGSLAANSGSSFAEIATGLGIGDAASDDLRSRTADRKGAALATVVLVSDSRSSPRNSLRTSLGI